jgi:tetratricopeptide (TPR) repeat protein
MRCAVFVVILVLGLAAVGGNRVQAQGKGASVASSPGPTTIDERTRKSFDAGRAAYDVGDYSRALEQFQQAYELSDRPQLLYNIGQCADRLRLDETALAAFRRYIERVPDAANRYQVEQRISVLQDVVSTKLQADSADAAPQDGDTKPEPSALDQSMKPSGAPHADSDDSSIWSKWWLWAAAGGVVVVTIVGIAIASGGDEQKEGAAVAGTDGNVVATLRWSGP